MQHPAVVFCCQTGHATGRSNKLLILSRNTPASPKVLPVCSGAFRTYGNTCCQQCDMGPPCMYFHQPILSTHFFALCSSLITGLCLMVLISNFQPVSSHYNLILPSYFIFNCDFMSSLPQSLSTPLFCLSHCVTVSYPSAGSHPTPRPLLGNPVELTDL